MPLPPDRPPWCASCRRTEDADARTQLPRADAAVRRPGRPAALQGGRRGRRFHAGAWSSSLCGGAWVPLFLVAAERRAQPWSTKSHTNDANVSGLVIVPRCPVLSSVTWHAFAINRA